MHRHITQWYSPRIGIDMPLVTYGHAGPPLLMLPTASADFLEYERFRLIDSIAHHIDAGRLRVYSVNSVNRYSLMNDQTAGHIKAALLTAYDGYLIEEVLPWIRHYTNEPHAEPIISGASLGAYLAANTFLKHPDALRGLVAISGTYDIKSYMGGYYDDHVYFNNPADYFPNLHDDHVLANLRRRAIVILSGQGAYEDPGRSIHLSQMLEAKGVPHVLDLWGHDVSHDWPWWHKMMDHYINKLF